MDSLPDIDVNRGHVIDSKDFRGEISIQELEFTYQMRPDNQVSAGALGGVDPRGWSARSTKPSKGGAGCLVRSLMVQYRSSIGACICSELLGKECVVACLPTPSPPPPVYFLLLLGSLGDVVKFSPFFPCEFPSCTFLDQ